MSLPTVAIIGLSVAGVVLLGGGGAYLFTRKRKDEDEFADPVGKPASKSFFQGQGNSTYDKISAGYILGGKKKTVKKKTVKKRQHGKKKK